MAMKTRRPACTIDWSWHILPVSFVLHPWESRPPRAEYAFCGRLSTESRCFRRTQLSIEIRSILGSIYHSQSYRWTTLVFFCLVCLWFPQNISEGLRFRDQSRRQSSLIHKWTEPSTLHAGMKTQVQNRDTIYNSTITGLMFMYAKPTNVEKFTASNSNESIVHQPDKITGISRLIFCKLASFYCCEMGSPECAGSKSCALIGSAIGELHFKFIWKRYQFYWLNCYISSS